MKKKIPQLLCAALAATMTLTLCAPAFASEPDTDVVLSEAQHSDELTESIAAAPMTPDMVPIAQTNESSSTTHKITKVFEVTPDFDPTPFTEDFEYDGLIYHMESIVKASSAAEKSKDVHEEHSVIVSASKEDTARADAIKLLPSYIPYEKDGYSGILYPVLSTMTLAETGRTNRSGSSTTTKQYTLEYNDDDLVPATVSENGQNYTMQSVTWADGQTDEDGIPENYVATATYTRRYSYSVVDGYEATMLYAGTVKNPNETIQYTVTYLGNYPDDAKVQIKHLGRADKTGDTSSEDDANHSNVYMGVAIFAIVVIFGSAAIALGRHNEKRMLNEARKSSGEDSENDEDHDANK